MILVMHENSSTLNYFTVKSVKHQNYARSTKRKIVEIGTIVARNEMIVCFVAFAIFRLRNYHCEVFDHFFFVEIIIGCNETSGECFYGFGSAVVRGGDNGTHNVVPLFGPGHILHASLTFQGARTSYRYKRLHRETAETGLE